MECQPALFTRPLSLLATLLPDPAVPEELALARAARGGNRAAFAELVRRAQGSVFGLCYRLLGEREAATDAAQEAFVRAFSALDSFDPTLRFDTWVLRIARNHCYDLLRRRPQLASEEEAAQMPDAAPTALDRLESAEITRNLESALETLPAQDREVLALYYVQRRKTREIAAMLGVAPGTIMARLFRAREKLRTRLVEVSA
ncbi:MAG: sigma-70 family RNA polymerase sigma factor [Deltaproteobacteria bacterium]|nr:sigma-70 family RNA polymerase sigma factor [Deltaproteobacteria bacterium]